MKAFLRHGISFVTIASLVTLISCKPAESPAPPTTAATQPPAEPPVPGPIPGTRMTEAYVSQVARSAYVWGWPMVNVHNRSVIMSKVPEPGYMAGIVPVAPPNQLAMLHD
jgi:hypothetical protein